MIESRIKAQAYGLGFDLVGITTLGPASTAEQYDAWVAKGYHGEMGYMARNADIRRDTLRPFEGVRSAIVVAMSYGGDQPSGPVARYARGDDYHDIMWAKLDALRDWIAEQVGHPVHGRSYVDTGPILERDLARKAGLGWFGKNTMLINPRAGSFFFLGSLLLDLELEADTPFTTDHCGTCTRCIDACPTGAIVEPHVIDARRCISYLTIELRGDIPEEFHRAIGEHVYGCDVCQEVCPWNGKFALPLREEAYRPRAAIGEKDARSLATELAAISDDDFRSAYRKSAMKRAKLQGLKRNAAVVLGNLAATAGSQRSGGDD